MQTGRDRLREWITRSKLNQRQAAEILSMTEVFLSQILNGVRTPGLANAIKIEDITGVSARSWQVIEISEEPVAVRAAGAKRQR